MKQSGDETNRAGMGPSDSGNAANDETTGLPCFRRWRTVYLFVLGCFVCYVVFLVALKWAFS